MGKNSRVYLRILTFLFLSQPIFAQKQLFHFTPEQKNNQFYNSLLKWSKEDAGNLPVPKNAWLCIGSSSIRKWTSIQNDLAPLPIIPRGFGGSTMSDVLLFKDFFIRYQARKILVYEGDNDLVNEETTPELIFEYFKEFIEYIEVQTPGTEIWFLSVKPSIARRNLWKKATRFNELLKNYSEKTANLHYIDIATPMIDANGSIRSDIFVSDSLHMNETGYAIWTQVIHKQLVNTLR